MLLVVVLLVSLVLSGADITGQDPPAGTCICLAETGVNVRASRKHLMLQG